MDEGDSKNNTQIKRQKQSPDALQRHGIDAPTIQSKSKGSHKNRMATFDARQ